MFLAQYYPGDRKLELCKLTGKVKLELAEKPKAKEEPVFPSKPEPQKLEYTPVLPAELLASPLEVPGKKYVPLISNRNVQVTIFPLSLEMNGRAGEIRFEIIPNGFWRSKETIGKDVYDLIEFDTTNPSHTVDVGQFMVPIKVIEIEIPSKTRVKEVTLKPQVLTTIKNISLPPVLEPRPVEQIVVGRKKETHAKSEDLSKSDRPYPGIYHEIIGIQHHGKQRLLLIKMFLAQYYPGDRKLELYKLTGKVKLELAEELKTNKK